MNIFPTDPSRLARSLATFVALCSAMVAFGQSSRLPTDRGQITVESIRDPLGGPNLKVLRTDNKTPLRAGTAWIWSQQGKEEPSNYYAELRGQGLNAVRIVLFDTWEKEAGYFQTDWNNPEYRTEMLARIERAVNHCSKNGLYAVINSHNKIPLFDVPYNQALWKYVAPFFKNRTHVIYEMDNESLEGTGIIAGGVFGGNLQRMKDLRATFDQIRSAAPNTHVMVLTPAGVSGWGYVDGLARMTRVFEAQSTIPINWRKTSVSYHLYHADENLFPQAQNLRNFHSQFPGWPSENNFPSSVTNAQLGITDTWRSVSFGKDVFLNQTCERLGLGWSHWNINGMAQFQRNWPILWADAVEKKYTWSADPVYNAISKINAGAGEVPRFFEDINFYGGKSAQNNPTGPVQVAGVANAAPADVYRSERWGNFTYTFAGLSPMKPYVVRLHFCESYSGITATGQRLFNVYGNGQKAINRLDVFALAGKVRNRAVVRDIRVQASRSGRIELRFESVVQSAMVSGLEVIPASGR